ncbi:hypothetical protein TraAM80_01182 [Trypanosoma rangeli]|uniref:Uncharacterized protein n=1 Tax=Trypanosoma rangeli TaxID=5698 RepID=A0A422P045_TRYRA|nr:uncharacterized protein TraAM80_01182 [Trypanosoma rangeli]RNF11055.1 hypothetical protein TraAM80_01182 [Trypanosoma rangeli]|eukprot:RNF11055.1 hypothetical protein TraAM80_01182 [Trypanosoma rangeli]
MPTAEAPCLPAVPASYRDRLVAFFKLHDETKLGHVEALLEKYAGKEERLMSALVKKYASLELQPEIASADPPARDSYEECRAAVVTILQRHDPSRLAQVDRLLLKHKGREDAVLRHLQKKYLTEGVVPPPDAPQPPPSTTPSERDDYSQRLASFFLLYDPEKVPHVDKILRKYRGREEKMLAALVRRFGPEPSSPKKKPSAEAEGAPSVTLVSEAAFAARLRRFFTCYDAIKLQGSHVDELVHNFCEAPEALFDELTQLYGPEPPEAVPQPQLPTEAEVDKLLPVESCVTLATEGSENDLHHTLSGATVPAAVPAENGPRAVDATAFIRFFSAEWCLTEEQQADASRRLDTFFRPIPAGLSPQAAQGPSSAVAFGVTSDRHTWPPLDVSHEELQRWREQKLLLSDRLAWRRRLTSRR